MPDSVFLVGKILQKYRLVTDKQLAQVLQVHEQLAGRVSIEDLLLSQGLLTSEQALWLQRAVELYEAQILAAGTQDGTPRAAAGEAGVQEVSARGAGRMEPAPAEHRRVEADPLPLSDTPQVVATEAAQTPVEPLGWPAMEADSRQTVRPGEPARGAPPEETEGQGGQPVRPLRAAIGRVTIGALRLEVARRRRETEEQEPRGPLAELHRLLVEAQRAGASDLLMSSDHPPAMRVAGELMRVPAARPPAELLELLLPQLLTAEQLAELQSWGALTLVRSGPGLRYRLTVVQKAQGWHVSARLVPPRPPGLEELGLPKIVARMAALPSGLVLCAGPAGGGKTTTLAALVEEIGGRRGAQILALEDHPEFVHRPRRGEVHALRGSAVPLEALAHDGEVIVIDELRPGSRVALALALAEAGRLVICAVQASDVASALSMLVEAGPFAEQPGLRRRLGRTLGAAIAQRLLRRADGRGLVPAVEVVLATPEVASLIEEGRLLELPAVLQRDRARGQCSLEDALHALLEQGTVDADAIRAHLPLS
ncbi:MAG: ATPase, T2SS/T4P/T4SS family [Myxococcales bacterium]|nr:ATPase, T2SS/T4P/T4SS family [Myxococcota bacterium]MDW8280552.1 ATPase, T2SS/T4P/T4SS family [Myxococcales bacterium]